MQISEAIAISKKQVLNGLIAYVQTLTFTTRLPPGSRFIGLAAASGRFFFEGQNLALLYNLDLIQQLSDDDQGPETGVTINDLKRLSQLESQAPKNDLERYLARLYNVDKY